MSETDIDLGVDARGPKGDPGVKGDKGDKGDSGANFYYSTYEAQPNQSTMNWTDLHPTANPPRVGEHVIMPSGKIYEIVGVNTTADSHTYEIGEQLADLHGKQGPRGDVGLTGPKGPKGDQGAPGDTGKQGAQGVPGDKGDPGKSAYQIWVEAGNWGTQDDYFKSLKGPKGDPGNDGAPGKTPVRGVDYWTDADIDAMHKYITDEFVNHAW